MPNPEQYPMINGNRYDFSSVEISLGGITYNGFKSISYKHKMTPGKLRGNHAAVIGRTRGTYEVETVTFEMWKADFQRLVAALRQQNPTLGYMEVTFPIVVNFVEPIGDGICTDTLLGCRLISDEHGGSEGSDPLTAKGEIDALRLLVDGHPASTAKGFATAVS